MALVRFTRRCKHALRQLDIAAVELRLCSLRFLFHAHPAQFSNEPDQLVRFLSWRLVGELLLFARHLHTRCYIVARFCARRRLGPPRFS
jgi:hypothetical protein